MELDRYAAQVRMPELGEEGQKKLAAARVLQVGVGGIGSACALELVYAGIGKLGISEGDTVEASNLNRQLLYEPADVGRKKAQVASDRILRANPDVQIEIHPAITEVNGMGILRRYDLAIDGTDAFATKLLLSDLALRTRVPLVHGAATGMRGQVTVIRPGEGPCLRCFFEGDPNRVPTGATEGILGATAGVIGCLQAAEAIKLIVGIGEPLAGKLLFADLAHGELRIIPIQKKPGCPACA